MSVPVDEKLYNETKKEVDKIYDKPSAYRSMAYTRFYLRAFREKYGEKKAAYKGKRPGELERWRREKWVDIRSFLDTPKNPIACGGVEYGKKEYPLCMPESKARKYTKEELSALLYRKSELGKTRLVKEPYLRDLYGEPLEEVKTKDIKPLKEPKIQKQREAKQARPKRAKKVVEAEVVEEVTEKEPIPKRPRGRPKKERSEEQIKSEQLKKESLERRRAARATRLADIAARREDRQRRRAAKEAARPQFIVPPEGSIIRTQQGIVSFD